MAQTLSSFSQQIPSNTVCVQNGRGDIGDGQPCNTPTASSSFGFGQIGDITRRSSSSLGGSRSRSRKNSMVDETWGDVDGMDEDEQMVEDILLTPSSPSITAPHFVHSHFHHHQPQMPPPSSARTTSISSAHNSLYPEPPSGASLFTTTDPFYIAQLQALQNPQPSSIFAQSARPAQHSPFFQHPRHQFVHAVPASVGRQG